MLSAIKSNDADGQVTAAVALIKMNVSPVITIRIPFGGDNHTDDGLMRSEVPQHESGIRAIGQLMEALRVAGLQDQVTFAAYNVFGRTLKKNGVTGRDHWGSHHATMMMGAGLRAGVVGGLEPKASDYYATPIDSQSGQGQAGRGGHSVRRDAGSHGQDPGRGGGGTPGSAGSAHPGGQGGGGRARLSGPASWTWTWTWTWSQT